MFKLRESSRRRLCRVGFILFCALPTAGVLAWGASMRSAGYQRGLEQALSRQLGLAVQADRASHPRPGLTLYEELSLSDAETGAVALSCRRLEVEWNEGTLMLVASQPVVETAQLARVWQTLARRLERDPACAAVRVRLLPCDLTLAGEANQTFCDVSLLIEAGSRGEELQLGFRLPEADMPQRATLRLVRDCQSSPATTNLSLDTGGASLPCEVLAPLCQTRDWLGERATFRGSFWAERAAAGWEGEIVGIVDQVELDRLIGDHYAQRISALATIEIQKARLRQQESEVARVLDAAGSIVAGPGRTDRRLLESAIAQLGMRLAPQLAPLRETVLFQELGLQFEVDEKGLRLGGLCQNAEEPGAVLLGADGSALLGEPLAAQPVINVVRFLAPQSAIQVPATRQTEWLLRLLPLPDLQPSSRADAKVRPRPRMRVGAARPD